MVRFLIIYSSIVLSGSFLIALSVKTPLDAFLLGLPLGIVASILASSSKR